jgi:hypothetical protein
MTNTFGQQSAKAKSSWTDDAAVHKMTSELIRPLLMLLRSQICHCQTILFSGNPIAPNDVDDLGMPDHCLPRRCPH